MLPFIPVLLQFFGEQVQFDKRKNKLVSQTCFKISLSDTSVCFV